MIEPSASPGWGAEEVQRQRADDEIYRVVRQAGFRGALWRQLAEELARYGCGVLEAWMVSGVLGGKVSREGHGGVAVPWQLSALDREAAETRRELAGETVAEALVLFRRKLGEGQWNPTGGRSLASYFMGACLYAFPNVLRRWQRCENRWTSAMAAMTTEAAIREDTVHPDRDVDVMMTLDALLAGSADREAEIVRLAMNRYTSAEIAHVLGGTPAGVRSALQRWRTRTQLKLVDDEGAGDEWQR